jgi:hypothetical protein
MTHLTSSSATVLPPEQRLARQYQGAIARLLADGLTPDEATGALIVWLQLVIDRQKLAREIGRAHSLPCPSTLNPS